MISYYPTGFRAPKSHHDQGLDEIQKGFGHLYEQQKYPAIAINANKENLDRI